MSCSVRKLIGSASWGCLFADAAFSLRVLRHPYCCCTCAVRRSRRTGTTRARSVGCTGRASRSSSPPSRPTPSSVRGGPSKLLEIAFSLDVSFTAGRHVCGIFVFVVQRTWGAATASTWTCGRWATPRAWPSAATGASSCCSSATRGTTTSSWPATSSRCGPPQAGFDASEILYDVGLRGAR